MADSVVSLNAGKGMKTSTGKSKQLLGFGIFIAVVLIGVIFAVAFHTLSSRKQDAEAELLKRQKTIVDSRVKIAVDWLQSMEDDTKRLVTADIFKLFASEVDKLPDDVPLLFAPDKNDNGNGDTDDQTGQFRSQLPLMRGMLADFVAYSKFSGAKIVNSRAQIYISTDPSDAPLDDRQVSLVKRVIESGAAAYSPIKVGDKGMILEMYMPIMSPEYERQSARPVAVAVFSIQMDTKIAEFLNPGAVPEPGASLHLVQKEREEFQGVVAGTYALHTLPQLAFNEAGVLPFDRRPALDGKGAAYSYGAPVRNVGWWIVQENVASIMQAKFDSDAETTYGLAALVSLALALLISSVWWRLVGREQAAITSQIRDYMKVIDSQKRLLDGINNTITDPISLTDDKGVYRYVNKAFALAVGRTEEDVPGLDGPAVFGFDTAKRLNASDQHVLMTGESVTVNEILWLQSKRYHFQISKAPLRDPGSRTPQGIVSVFRDISKLVETEERSRRMVQQTINALVSAIEEVDPFLGGHSRIMGGVAGLVSRRLGLSDFDTATIEAAANLSQIGKMFVPREILLKPGALTPEEKQQMEMHVEHARNALEHIEFDLPVVDAIYQMNERLDGKGYPKGLTDGSITMHARVLAVANAFAAMAKPRSYRPALPVLEVLAILEKQNASYDPNVVAALREVLNTPAGERLVEQAASSKAV